MDKNNRELKTVAYVIRRTNYGETDRILNLLTPEGKISVIAKGVRRARSKLAGGIEMFTLSSVNLHYGRGKLATLTSAKMLKFHKNILRDLDRMELAGDILRKTERVLNGIESREHFEIVKNVLEQLDTGVEVELASAWFTMNLARIMGEQVNFYTDITGARLKSGMRYSWNVNEMAFYYDENGAIDEDGIKILRLMITAELAVVRRISGINDYLPEILKISKVFDEVVK